MSKPGLTQALAAWAARPQDIEIGAAVRRTVRSGFIDTAATVLAGRDEPVVAVLQRHLACHGAQADEARVLFGSQRASARDAAWINATAAHALDYDDVALQGHPSAVLVPLLLAEGERLHASGEALLRAYVVGYETWAELIERDADLHHLKGWHPTAVFGVVAGAAALIALRGLDAVQGTQVLGIAASLAGGLVANFGSMVKPFHAGQAAAHAVDAANLAQAGLTAAGDALEHPAGLLAALSPQGRVDRERPLQGGRSLRIAELGLSVKKYPMCFAAHRAIDATLDLAVAHNIAPADVAAVQVCTGVAQAAMLRHHAPRTASEAKFSLEFAVAAALVARRVGLAQLDAAFIARPDVQALFSRLQVHRRDTACPTEPTLAASDRVVIELHDGRRLDSGEVDHARGSAQRPCSPDELALKFRDCVAGVVGIDTAQLLARLGRIDGVADVAKLLN
jgi:2-methylcitrate dehydratase PrpD